MNKTLAAAAVSALMLSGCVVAPTSVDGYGAPVYTPAYVAPTYVAPPVVSAPPIVIAPRFGYGYNYGYGGYYRPRYGYGYRRW
jgi:hypothetical protein